MDEEEDGKSSLRSLFQDRVAGTTAVAAVRAWTDQAKSGHAAPTSRTFPTCLSKQIVRRRCNASRYIGLVSLLDNAVNVEAHDDPWFRRADVDVGIDYALHIRTSFTSRVLLRWGGFIITRHPCHSLDIHRDLVLRLIPIQASTGCGLIWSVTVCNPARKS